MPKGKSLRTIVRKCDWCGNEYDAQRRTSKYCGDNCRNYANKASSTLRDERRIGYLKSLYSALWTIFDDDNSNNTISLWAVNGLSTRLTDKIMKVMNENDLVWDGNTWAKLVRKTKLRRGLVKVRPADPSEMENYTSEAYVLQKKGINHDTQA